MLVESYEASADAIDRDGMTPLALARMHRRMETAMYLHSLGPGKRGEPWVAPEAVSEDEEQDEDQDEEDDEELVEGGIGELERIWQARDRSRASKVPGKGRATLLMDALEEGVREKDAEYAEAEKQAEALFSSRRAHSPPAGESDGGNLEET